MLEFVVALTLALTTNQTGLSFIAVRVIAISLNCVACVFLGVAANKLGKNWLLYGLLPALGTLIIFSFYSYIKLRSDAWLQWADSHATHSSDHQA
jgi:hypothetical protein